MVAEILFHCVDSGWFRLRVAPGIVFGYCAVLADAEVLADTLPWAGVWRVTFGQKLLLHARRRKVPIPLYVDKV